MSDPKDAEARADLQAVAADYGRATAQLTQCRAEKKRLQLQQDAAFAQRQTLEDAIAVRDKRIAELGRELEASDRRERALIAQVQETKRAIGAGLSTGPSSAVTPLLPPPRKS